MTARIDELFAKIKPNEDELAAIANSATRWRSNWMAGGAIRLGEIAAFLPMLEVRCDNCGRHGRYNTAKLVAKYGSDSSVQPFQEDLRRQCSERDDPR